MNIALVSQEYPPETGHGGIATQTRLKAHGLSRRGHRVYVISHCGSDEPSRKLDGDVEVIRVGEATGGFRAQTEATVWLMRSVSVASALYELQRRVQLDVIDFPDWAAEGYAYLLNRPSWSQGPAVVIQLHGMMAMLSETIGWPEKESELYEAGRHMEGFCLRHADAVFASSACSAGWAERSYGLVAREMPVIHSGIETKIFTPAPAMTSREPTVLFAGRISESKGAEVVLRACASLQARVPGLRLRFAGRAEPNYREHLTSLMEELDASEMVAFCGPLNRDELVHELQAAHVFAAPSFYEGGPGFAYLEAMGCGLPVVACSGSGIDEVVTHGHEGFLLPSHDVNATAKAIGELLTRPALREEMSRNARRRVLAEADTRACVARIESFYVGVLARAGEEGA